VKGEIYHMKRKAFLLELGLVGFLATAFSSCGATTSSSVAATSSSAPTVYNTATGTNAVDANGADLTFEPGDDITGGGTGAYSYVNKTYGQRAEILGALEKSAYKNNLTGMPLFENGSYVMYANRVTKGVNTYIPGYGFSIIRDGNITSDMSATNEPTEAYRSYYHGSDANDPGSINALDTDGSQIADMMSNIASGYFGTKLNTAKDGYNWYGVLSTDDKPVAVKTVDAGDDRTKDVMETGTLDETKLYSTWRVHMRTGTAGKVTYRTGSKQADRAAFDGKAPTIDDYEYAWKVLLNAKIGYYRGSELASQTGKQAIVGAQAYYNVTGEGDDNDTAKAMWKKVGIKKGTDSTGDFLQFTFKVPVNQFTAMYNLAESNYEPINKDFYNLVTNNLENPTYYGGYSKDKTYSPVDNILSIGPYYLEAWQADKEIAYKRNDSWYEITENPNLYRIKGIHTQILPAINTDADANIKEFINGNLDASGISKNYLQRYKSDPRAVQTKGDSVFKLNLNTTTKAQWEKLFGTDGTITQTATADYWDVKPWMSNNNFVKGLLFSIDRATFAANRGYVPSCDFFSSNYMSDPENGVSYNSTDAHKAAVESCYTALDGKSYADKYGYSKDAAIAYFKKAVQELVKSGDVKEGTADNPTEMKITIWWMYQNNITNYGDEIASYLTGAFNDAAVDGNKVKLVVEQKAVDVWYNVYYEHLMLGQFDLGFGSISGNAMDPLNFMEVLKSDNSSGFTLNWGSDTSELDPDLTYGGQSWSFDSLWKAADSGVIVKGGHPLPAVVMTYGKSKLGDDLSMTIDFTYQDVKSYYSALPAIGSADLEIKITDFYLSRGSFFDYIMDDTGTLTADDGYLSNCSVDTATKTVQFTISPALLQALGKKKYFTYNVDYTVSINGITAGGTAGGYIYITAK
jgi:hypothetical protein